MSCSATAAVLLAATLLFDLPCARSQSPAPIPANASPFSMAPEEAIRRLDRNDIPNDVPTEPLAYAMVAAKAPRKESIPALERFYAKHQDDPLEMGAPLIRNGIASLLVQLGDPNPLYWNLLVSEANDALSSHTPLPSTFDLGQQDLESLYTPEQKAWAKAHNLSLNEIFQQAFFVLPFRFSGVAYSKDPRAIPILRAGLNSKNSIIQQYSATGLGLLRDKDSIPLIIAICRPDPARFYVTAESLLLFRDPAADSAYHQFFPSVNIEQLRQQLDRRPASSNALPSGTATPAPHS